MAVMMTEREAVLSGALPKGWHAYMNITLDYIGEMLGSEGVEQYLTEFANEYYALEMANITVSGLLGMQRFIEDLYRVEGCAECVNTVLKQEGLIVEVSRCPALYEITTAGYKPSRWFVMTTSVVYGRLAQMAGLHFSLLRYDEETGAAAFSFAKGGSI